MLPLLSRISLVKFLKIIAPKTGEIPQKCSVSDFREASGLVPLFLLKINFSTGVLPKLVVMSL